jgi:hypothetical protein
MSRRATVVHASPESESRIRLLGNARRPNHRMSDTGSVFATKKISFTSNKMPIVYYVLLQAFTYNELVDEIEIGVSRKYR